MDHVAILRRASIKKGDNLLNDILEGTKTIESRWYVNKVAPWSRIETGDTLYFKESGCPVTAKATVSKVLQYENLTTATTEKIIEKYGQKIAPNTTKEEFLDWAKTQSKKRYCILVFLKDAEKIEPFEIDKTGYGISSAWLVTENISKLKKYVKKKEIDPDHHKGNQSLSPIYEKPQLNSR